MKLLLIVTLGLYATCGPLCPVQLQAATMEREAAVPMMSARSHDTAMHGKSEHADTMSHTDCGEEDHCQLGETVDSAGAIAVQETVSTYPAGGISTYVDSVFFDANIANTMVDRPPPLSPLITVVLRQ